MWLEGPSGDLLPSLPLLRITVYVSAESENKIAHLVLAQGKDEVMQCTLLHYR